MSDHLPSRQAYRFGPIGLFVRFKRWHMTAPTWQILLLTLVLLVLIALVWSGMFRR